MDASAKALMPRRLAAICFVICALLLWAPATPAAAPVRIISLVPAVTEMIYAIGAGPQMIGVSSYDHYPAAVEKLPKLGGLVDPDVERILALRPDLVIVYGAKNELNGRLARAGIATFPYDLGDLANVTTTMKALGERLGHAREAGAEIARIESGLNAIRARVASQPRIRTMLIFGREPGSLRGVYAAGGVGFLHDLLTVAGGDDVFADVKRENIQIGTEQILIKAPEAVIELYDSLTPQQLAKERAVWSQLPSLPAVKNNRIHLLASETLTIPGPRIVEAAQLIADALHPAVKK